MDNKIQIENNTEVTLLLSDVFKLDFSNIKHCTDDAIFIIHSLINDILTTRKDIKTTIYFYFQQDSFKIHFQYSYPFLFKDVSFSFQNNYPDIKNTINSILNQSIENTKINESASLNNPDLLTSYSFIENIEYIDKIFNFKNELKNYIYENPFKLSLFKYKEKKEFLCFQVEKEMNSTISLELNCPFFSIFIYSSNITLSFNGSSFTINKKIIKNNNQLNNISQAIILLFNSTTNLNVKNIEELKIFSDIISV